MAGAEAHSDVRNLVSRWEPKLSYRWVLSIYLLFISRDDCAPKKASLMEVTVQGFEQSTVVLIE